jgi:hypothetical protein
LDWSTLVEGLDAAVLEVLGVPSLYTTSASVVVPLDKVIFDDGHVRVQAGQAGMTDTRPWLFTRLDKFPSDPEEDQGQFTHGGAVYRIVEVQRDGQGAARFILNEA